MKTEHHFNREDKLELYGEGEWIDEPDHVEFEHLGYKCEIKRNSIGALCGYIFVTKGHPWHGYGWKDHGDENCRVDIDVHGGTTYHEADEGNTWKIGFDCAHCGDFMPGLEKSKKQARNYDWGRKLERMDEELKAKFPDLSLFNLTYKNIAFVTKEIESMCEQAEKAKG